MGTKGRWFTGELAARFPVCRIRGGMTHRWRQIPHRRLGPAGGALISTPAMRRPSLALRTMLGPYRPIFAHRVSTAPGSIR